VHDAECRTGLAENCATHPARTMIPCSAVYALISTWLGSRGRPSLLLTPYAAVSVARRLARRASHAGNCVCSKPFFSCTVPPWVCSRRPDTCDSGSRSAHRLNFGCTHQALQAKCVSWFWRGLLKCAGWRLVHGEGSADAIRGGMTQAFILCPAVLLVMGENGDERRLLERLCHHLLLDVLQRPQW